MTGAQQPSVFIPMEKLLKLVETLRGPDGCPWDRKQTPKSISVYLVEEVHELVDAIAAGDPAVVCEELGDVLFHVVFIAHLFQEQGAFSFDDVAQTVREKMIRRHPHVFGQGRAETTQEIRQQWRQIKKTEKPSSREGATLLARIPSSMPALMRAYRISERAAGQGFDWHAIDGVIAKAEEEWRELKAELDRPQKRTDRGRVALEFGDVLFTLVNVARFAGIHPETALTDSIRKFIGRFEHMETAIAASGRKFEAVSHEELQVLWKDAKAEVK